MGLIRGSIMCNLKMALLLSAVFLPVATVRADQSAEADFRPDPRSVQWYGPAYRYPQEGWIVLHIEGEPYERGYQHGRLMAPEIAAFLKASAAMISPSAPSEGWRNARTLINSLFVRRYDQEYLEEMKGIADGATAAGARYEGRPVDLTDIVGLNVWPEIETLPSALEATPTGLEGMRFPHSQPRAMPEPKPMHCSAFAATGPATRDGKIVFGHITMFGLYASYFYNVWLDVKPSKGHRVLIQGYPGAIQSGLDYYLNDAGILSTETTIAQTRFDITGYSVASRIRQALQYADSIDQAVAILSKANNGLYTNEWLLADIKTNEIAMFELGTHRSRLYRSSKNEWFGGTEGFYWGCNNTKDLNVRLETIPGVKDRPENMCFCPSDRDKLWQRLYQEHKGKIDADFGKLAFTTPPLAAYHSLDAKFTTTDLARQLKTWALYGPPLGRSWQPSDEEKRRYPDIRPLVSNPWTILTIQAPAKEPEGSPLAADMPERIGGAVQTAMRHERLQPLPSEPAWHGTILPKGDADLWLATAFAEYEKIVARENALAARNSSGLTEEERNELAVRLYQYRSSYLAGARTGSDVPLAGTHADISRSDWYQVATGKGVLVLNELRHLLGKEMFVKLMDSFGRDNAGKEVTSEQFQTRAERVAGKSLQAFFDYWLRQPGLPSMKLGRVAVVANGKGYRVEGEIVRDDKAPPTTVRLTVETGKGSKAPTARVSLTGPSTPFVIETSKQPERLIVDKYGTTARAGGGAFTIYSFYSDLEHTLIAYATAGETASNREAAESLQRQIIQSWSNVTVPIKKDTDVTEDDLKNNHLLLIGRPDTSAVIRRFQEALPVTFGWRSFIVRNQTYAHAGSAVIAAAENPLNGRYSLTILAGLSPESTLHAPEYLRGRGEAAEVLVLPNHDSARALVIPAKNLIKELRNGGEISAARPALESASAGRSRR
jgi:hypothetical protein